ALATSACALNTRGLLRSARSTAVSSDTCPSADAGHNAASAIPHTAATRPHLRQRRFMDSEMRTSPAAHLSDAFQVLTGPAPAWPSSQMQEQAQEPLRIRDWLPSRRRALRSVCSVAGEP